MGAGQGNVVARRQLPLLRELFADEHGIDAIGVQGKIESPGDNSLQRFVAVAFTFQLDSFGNYAACFPRKGEQYRLIHGGRNRAHPRCGGKFRRQRLVIADAARARPRERHMRRDTQQTVLQGFAKTRVHGQGDDQRGDSRGDSDHRKRRHQAQYRGTVRRPQVPPGHKPFEFHAGLAR